MSSHRFPAGTLLVIAVDLFKGIYASPERRQVKDSFGSFDTGDFIVSLGENVVISNSYSKCCLLRCLSKHGVGWIYDYFGDDFKVVVK